MKKFQDIDSTALHALLDTQKVYLIDVRNNDEVAQGVIPGATFITLSSIPSETVVFYCHAGVRSAQAAAFVADQIDASVYNLRGGILAWANAGYGFTQLSTT
jgi:rhodanese-related sulfurtransferase